MHLQQRPSHHAQSHRHTRTRVRCGSAQQDLYAVLGVAYDADAAAIRAAFRAKAKETHPDVLGGEEAAFRLVKRAHEVLSDAMLRANHDMELREAAGDGDAAAALRARDPRFARFERWRREIMPDVNAQLDEWTAEVLGVLSAAEAALAVHERSFQQLLMQAAPGAGSLCSSSGGYSAHDGQQADAAQQRRQREGAALLQAMRGALADAAGNVQRLYDKRYEQMSTRYSYPAIVWWDRWLEVSDEWLNASARLAQTWQPRVRAVAQWLQPADGGGGDAARS